MDKLPPELVAMFQERHADTPFADCPYWFQVSHVNGSSFQYGGESVVMLGLEGVLTDEDGDGEYPLVLALDLAHATFLIAMLSAIVDHEQTGRPWLMPVDGPSD